MTARHRLARTAYSLLMAAAVPAYLARLWWRGGTEPAYRRDIAQRLGWYAGPASRGWIWVHAVSLGETRAAAALIQALRRQRPGMRLLLTHGTATGREAGRPLLAPGDRQIWQPFDTPGAARRFFRHCAPAVGVLMETEVWPNLLFAAQAAGVPMVLANARLSEKSRAQGERFDAVLGPAVASLSLVLAQTEDDAARLSRSGARRVEVSGNLKFDMTPDESLLARGRAWRQALHRPVILAASTREGEEPMLLTAWQQQMSELPKADRPLLLIVPRHPQRFDEVADMVRREGMTLARRSSWQDGAPPSSQQAEVWLGDSLGEMPLYFALADVALLGGSFAPLGGQNLIEAAACGCRVVMGPHTFNFAEAAEMALAAGVAVRVDDLQQGLREALGMLNASTAGLPADEALRFAAAHRGAARRMAQAIVDVLDRRS